MKPRYKQNMQPNSNQPNTKSQKWKKREEKRPKKVILSKQKYHEVSITYLYLSNLFNLIKKIFLKS
jgi:hypothetical protein